MRHQHLFIVTAALIAATSCSKMDEDEKLIGKWDRRSDFDGLARSEATTFTIGDKGYLIGGYDGRKHLGDLWEYDMERDFWTQKAPFPGSPRSSAVAVSVGGKGYFGTGYDGKDYYNDFWEYDPATNTWTQKADFPGSARNDATAFALTDKGYVGSGYDGNYQKDFYAYDPHSDSWEQIVSLGGSKRRGATSFVIDNTAYVCTGINNGEYVKDFWKYDPSEGQWIQLRDIADSSDSSYDNDYDSIVRIYGVSFVIGGQAYVTCGGAPGLNPSSWRYSPGTDTWNEVAEFKASARTATVSFSNGSRGFVVTGKSGTSYFDDIWELLPHEYDDDVD